MNAWLPHMVFFVALPMVQSPSVVEELKSLAFTEADSVLGVRATEWPDEVYEAVRQLLRETGAEGRHFAAAERLAAVYATVWHDSLLAKRVTFFGRLSITGRDTFRQADSLRREGAAVIYRDGVATALEHWQRSASLFESIGESVGLAASLGNLGAGYYVGGNFDSSVVYLNRAQQIASLKRDLRVEGNAATMLGSISYARGDLRTASEHYTRALTLHGRAGNRRGVAADYNNIGLITQELGDLDKARDSYQSALNINLAHENLRPAAHNYVNLGNVAALEGGFDDADDWYRKALGIYEDLDEPVNAADARQNLGYLSIRLGDYLGARAWLMRALEVYVEAGATTDEIAVRETLSGLLAAIGDLRAALLQLEQAEATALRLDDNEGLLPDLALANADLALRFNMLSDADREYRRALDLYRARGDMAGQAEAQHGLGILLTLREDFAEAKDVFQLAARAQQAEGRARSAAWTQVLVAAVEKEIGDVEAARISIAEAVDSMVRLGDPVGEATALAALGELDRENGMVLAAEASFRRGIGLLSDRVAPNTLWQLHAGLGKALEMRGALEEAAEQYRAAISSVDAMSNALPVEQRRAAFLADKWDVYADYALLEHRRGNPEAAFAISERMRARQLLDLLARGRVAGKPEGNRAITSKEQALRRRIGDLTAQLEGPEFVRDPLRGPDLSSLSMETVREALARSQQEYSQLLLQARDASPRYASLVTGETVSAADAQQLLSADEVLLEFLLAETTSVVFVVTHDTTAVVDLNVNQQSIASLVDFVRGTLVRPQPNDERHLWRAPLRRLHQQLIQPLEDAGLLDDKNRLIIASHGDLHYLPFDALLSAADGDRYLIERYEISHVPSASVWVELMTRQRNDFSGMSRVLAMAPNDRALPGSGEEVSAIGRIFGRRATVLRGTAATEGAFTESAPEYDIIHLATYGVLNKHNPLFSFIEFGNAGDSDDGRLEVHEVFGLDLNARLIVLSACQTGLGSGALADVPPGDDWVGLVRAFLYAGASNVLATIWPVEDQATAVVMERFYRNMRPNVDEVTALTAAKRLSVADDRTAHPFYWAGFVLVGGG